MVKKSCATASSVKFSDSVEEKFTNQLIIIKLTEQSRESSANIVLDSIRADTGTVKKRSATIIADKLLYSSSKLCLCL